MKKKITALILCAALLISGCTGCGKNSDTGQLFRYDIFNTPGVMDPQTATSEEAFLILQNTMEGLFTLDENQTPTPGAVDRYSVSPDGLVYTFYLRRGLTWSDGKTPLTAMDFHFALQRLFDPATKSPYAEDFYCIAGGQEIFSGSAPVGALGVTAIDDTTLTITLNKPNQFFLSLLCTPAVLPCNENFFKEARGKYGVSGEFLLCNGPFYISGWNEGENITLKKNTHYHGEDTVAPAGVRLYIKDENDPARLSGGNVDAAPVLYSAVEGLTKSGYSITSFSSAVWAILPGGKEGSPLANEKLRQALALAIARPALAAYLPGNFTMAANVVPPAITVGGSSYRGMVGDSGGFEEIPYGAKTLWQAGLAELDVAEIDSLTLICPETDGIPLMLSQLQRQWLDELGVFINIEPLPPEDLASRVGQRDYDLALTSLKAAYDSPEAVLSQFLTQPLVDEATAQALSSYIESAKNTGSFSSSADYYKQSERLLLGSGLVIPLFYETNYYASAPGVNGLRFSPFGCHAYFSAGRKKP